MGCGIAAIASIVNDSYDNVLSKCKNPKDSEETGFYMPELKRILKLYNKDYSFRKYSSRYKNKLKIGTIIFISKSKKYPYGHYLSKIEESGWMNPWINCPIISELEAGIDRSISENQIEYILYKSKCD